MGSLGFGLRGSREDEEEKRKGRGFKIEPVQLLNRVGPVQLDRSGF